MTSVNAHPAKESSSICTGVISFWQRFVRLFQQLHDER